MPQPAVGPAGAETVRLRACLVENYARLHRRLSMRLGCADLARESLHDAWVCLGERRAAPAADCPQAYVYRVACNAAVDRLRADRPWRTRDEADLPALLEAVPDGGAGPAVLAELRSELRAVAGAAARLSRRDQAVLAAVSLDEQTRRQVACRYGLSLRKVDTALRRARDCCAAPG
ncbi:extracytoplasmic-function sigma-70 factor [Bordetella ansorpii]|mgnify:CR=1 FL=1|uniref:Extracytoplasmic-function sigma-70 factor n=1 Tax=Bordetella ansorpii TaxID=288768 RepID=A0A157LER4_9BORD|nr:sigma-70 family RNA polymerase sigma factor [Bordetella ansorpii]SAH95278.1 extracytoplasmic-function sigma-70 factor [Bordetella ansorpii]